MTAVEGTVGLVDAGVLPENRNLAKVARTNSLSLVERPLSGSDKYWRRGFLPGILILTLEEAEVMNKPDVRELNGLAKNRESALRGLLTNTGNNG